MNLRESMGIKLKLLQGLMLLLSLVCFLFSTSLPALFSFSLKFYWFITYVSLCLDTYIQKTKKLYLDTRTQRNIAKLNDELYEVHQIMTRNVQEVLGVGEKLDQVSEMSSRLTSDTRIYADKAKDLNRQAFIRKYAPVAIVIGVVIILFWAKNKIW
jgi:hypothetical protein